MDDLRLHGPGGPERRRTLVGGARGDKSVQRAGVFRGLGANSRAAITTAAHRHAFRREKRNAV
jgi:hypothetical protein